MEEKAGCFAIIVLQMYCYCKCSIALPHGDVGWSAVCDDHTHLFFVLVQPWKTRPYKNERVLTGT